MNKTRLLATVLGGLALGLAGLVQASAADKTTLVVMIRGLDNPYHANYAEGAKALGANGVPVKLQWTREDDIQGGRYRPAYVHKLEAALETRMQIRLRAPLNRGRGRSRG